ncbi:hypothetical protein HELRODRAFT_171534 [Helobdella robusta]|uniref:DED domain-containing protein n=1 Tax=Helobdella robusta TaxID=6412 RepID=T1F4E0_HELRO|nr:hypothetical protein HELRODRAFT_171534 [Helobdella robusta]ESO05193.1 hypothetical protein HELRODRAFT_171534 [Helobdella robusta]
MAVSFRELLIKLSQKISDKELDEMKFCLSDYGVGKRDRERVKKCLELWTLMEERALLSESNVSMLEKILDCINRQDLKEMLKNHKQPNNVPITRVTSYVPAHCSNKLHSMATRAVVINDVLYYMANNFHLLENENFINYISEFYTNEDIDEALNNLKYDMDFSRIKKCEKFELHGSRKEKILICISILKEPRSQKFMNNWPIFVSSNLAKIPNTNIENFLEINPDYLKETTNMLHIVRTLEELKRNCLDKDEIINKLLNQNKILQDRYMNDFSNLMSPGKKILQITYEKNGNSNFSLPDDESIIDTGSYIGKSENIWSNSQKSSAVDAFVQNKKYKIRSDNSAELFNSINELKSKFIVSKPIKKVIDNKANETYKRYTEKPLGKPAFFIGELKKCHRNNFFKAGKNYCSPFNFPMIKQTVVKNDTANKVDNNLAMFRGYFKCFDVRKMKGPNFMLKHRTIFEKCY